MYGTTIRIYNTNQSYRVEEEENFFNRNTTNNDMQETRYVKIEETPKPKEAPKTNAKPTANAGVVEVVSRKEFPIASVVFTGIITMLLLLVTTGVISW